MGELAKARQQWELIVEEVPTYVDGWRGDAMIGEHNDGQEAQLWRPLSEEVDEFQKFPRETRDMVAGVSASLDLAISRYDQLIAWSKIIAQRAAEE